MPNLIRDNTAMAIVVLVMAFLLTITLTIQEVGLSFFSIVSEELDEATIQRERDRVELLAEGGSAINLGSVISALSSSEDLVESIGSYQFNSQLQDISDISPAPLRGVVINRIEDLYNALPARVRVYIDQNVVTGKYRIFLFESDL